MVRHQVSSILGCVTRSNCRRAQLGDIIIGAKLCKMSLNQSLEQSAIETHDETAPLCIQKEPQGDTTTNPISKNQLKKQLRRDRWLEQRGERRKLEREKKKIARRIEAKKREERGEKLDSRKFTLMRDSKNKFRVVIDMNFEEYMTDAEIGKAVQQVGRIYALNRHSENPCQLFITSLKGKIKQVFQFKNAGYLNWDINHSESSYMELFEGDRRTTDDTGTIVKKPSKLVYLSGDSEHLLPDVDSLLEDESKIFVIGGLVDHNRHKNLCHQLAINNNISTAKFPIKEHLTLCQRHILSTVTAFEILLRVLGDHKQWPDALKSTIPKRKLATHQPAEPDKCTNLPDT